MPAIQDGYSINVSNRFDLAYKNSIEEGQESDSNEEIDPLEQLRLLEEQKQHERELKKKQKTQQSSKKNSSKRNVQFKENKDINIPHKKETSTDTGKNDRRSRSKREFSGKGSNNIERQHSGDENKRPPRRQSDQRRDRAPRDRGGDAERPERPFDDQFGQRNSFGLTSPEDRTEKREKGGRFERYRGGRGGFRGSGNYGYRGGNRSDGRDNRGKREFDRRSGSDRSSVRPTDKRDGGGPRNWGTPGNEIEETTEVNLSVEEVGNWADQVDLEQSNEEKQKSSSDKEDVEEKEAEEAEELKEVDPEMTLDEWKALQSNAASRKQEFNLRKPGEGEDSAKWKNMKLLHDSSKKANDAPVAHEEGHRRQTGKTLIDMNIHFSDMSGMRGKGGRGGRGSRGGRGGFRGGSRGGGGGSRYGNRYSQPVPPDVLNETEFPTLAA